MQAYYMAGPLGRYAATPASGGIHGYWLGEPAFDPRREMAWAYQAYQYLRRFFRDSSVSSYRVFIRALPGTGGGTALRNSFMVGTAPGTPDSTRVGPRSMIMHEMGHMFVGELSGSGLGEGAWFDEGLNTYYTRLLLLRSGLSPVADYERDINATARAYYSNPFRNASADSLARIGFAAGVGAGSAQNVAYTRGSLYFADVDAKIRAASGGTRKLDDVLLPLFERRRRGERVDRRMLVDELVRQIGSAARAEFDAVIVRGETLEPVSGAFGPCFERRPARYSTADREVDGFEWVRVQSIPEERCRQW
jgi:predicted metalloprotease with PDZ domain